MNDTYIIKKMVVNVSVVFGMLSTGYFINEIRDLKSELKTQQSNFDLKVDNLTNKADIEKNRLGDKIEQLNKDIAEANYQKSRFEADLRGVTAKLEESYRQLQLNPSTQDIAQLRQDILNANGEVARITSLYDDTLKSLTKSTTELTNLQVELSALKDENVKILADLTKSTEQNTQQKNNFSIELGRMAEALGHEIYGDNLTVFTFWNRKTQKREAYEKAIVILKSINSEFDNERTRTAIARVEGKIQATY